MKDKVDKLTERVTELEKTQVTQGIRIKKLENQMAKLENLHNLKKGSL